MKIKYLLLFFLVFSLQGNDLWSKNKSSDKAAEKAAQAVIDAQGSGKTYVTVKTSAGSFVVLLYDETPGHRDNFLRNIRENNYNGVLFHRAIKDFIIQGGDPSSKNTLFTASYGAVSSGDEIDAEIDDRFFHHRGALAAARTGDEVNPERKSSGSQFYIVQGKTYNGEDMAKVEFQVKRMQPEERRSVYRYIGGAPHLDGEYTVFGRVVKGMRTVDKIANSRTDRSDRPVRDIYIKSMTVKTKK